MTDTELNSISENMEDHVDDHHHHRHDEEHEHHEHGEHEHHHHEHHHHEHDEHEHHHEGGVDVHVHEGAVAASFEKDISGNVDEIKTKLAECMQRLRDEIKERHGVIGHIKASITSAEKTTMLSLTKDTIGEVSVDGSTIRLCFAAIVFNVDEGSMEELVDEIVFDRF